MVLGVSTVSSSITFTGAPVSTRQFTSLSLTWKSLHGPSFNRRIVPYSRDCVPLCGLLVAYEFIGSINFDVPVSAGRLIVCGAVVDVRAPWLLRL